jgi:hypothetical protein
MSVVVMTIAELALLGAMLAGLIRKRSHDRRAAEMHPARIRT